MKSVRLFNALIIGTLVSSAACAFGGPASTHGPLKDAGGTTEVFMGDGTITGAGIEPYDFSWTQCSYQDGEWTNMPSFRETLKIRADEELELTQIVLSPDGQRTEITHTLARSSLRRSAFSQTVTDADGTLSANASIRFSSEGFTVLVENQEHPGGAITSNMYGGAYLGLPLSTLDYSLGSFVLEAGMLAVQGTYRVEAIPAGIENMVVGERSVVAQRVDVSWFHFESGDTYEPGPNGSGGRYWLLTSPETGLPRVLAYKTDTYAIEFSPKTCSNR